MSHPFELDMILQKYLAGNRNPEVLQEISKAAWEAFHDPWEVRPDFHHFSQKEAPMKEQEILNQLASILAGEFTNYYRQENQPFFMVLLGVDGSPLPMQLRVGLSGVENTVLYIDMKPSETIPPDEVHTAMENCNAWNVERRWPKAFLVSSDPGRKQAPLQVVLELQMPISSGVSLEFLKEVTLAAIGSGVQFCAWRKARQQSVAS